MPAAARAEGMATVRIELTPKHSGGRHGHPRLPIPQEVSVTLASESGPSAECGEPVTGIDACTLTVPAGPALLVVHGDIEKSWPLDLREGATTLILDHNRDYPLAVVAGGIFTGAGLTIAGAGVYFLTQPRQRGLGAYMLGFAAVYVAPDVPVDLEVLRGRDSLATHHDPPTATPLAPQVAIGPGFLSLRWEF